MKIKLLSKLSISLYFLLIFLIGITIYKDFGVPWDEGICNLNGVINAFEINSKFNNILLSPDKVEKIKHSTNDSSKIVPLNKFKDRFYGSLNELILLAPAFILKKTNDTQAIYYVRHFTIFFIFWISLICFYFLLFKRFKNIWFAILGTTFLLISPRIFAHAFYNSKDIIFLSFLIFSLITAFKFFEKPNFRNAFIHALFSGLLVAIRIPGIFIVFTTILIFSSDIIVRIFAHKKTQELNSSKNSTIFLRKIPLILIFYLIFFAIFTIVFWPFLWENPFGHFLESFSLMSNFGHKPDLLFLGKFVNSSNLPFYYVFVWIFISTPILYTFLFLAGIISIIFSLKKNLLKNWVENDLKFDIFVLLAFLFPLLAAISKNSTLYNDWRHLYFIYPPFLFIGTLGFVFLFQRFNKKLSQIILYSTVAFSLIFTTYKMIVLHPYQMIYFNCLISNPSEKFEYEYWGMTYREALNRILEIDSSNKIVLYKQPTSPIPGSLRIIDKNKRDRITFSENLDSSKYFIDNFNSYYNNYNNFLKFYNLRKDQEIDSIVRDGNKLLSIFKLDSTNKINSQIKIPLLKINTAKPYQN